MNGKQTNEYLLQRDVELKALRAELEAVKQERDELADTVKQCREIEVELYKLIEKDGKHEDNAIEIIRLLQNQLAEQAEAIDLALHTNHRIKRLEVQLAECERERDGYSNELKHGALPNIFLLQEQLATVTKERDELVRIADGIKARTLLRGFYVPQDTADLIAALAKLGADKMGEKK